MAENSVIKEGTEGLRRIGRRFGNILRKIRKVRGLSIVELAKKSGTDQGYISRMENGHRNPPGPRILQGLANALDFKSDLLMMAAGYIELGPQGNPLSESEIIRLVEIELYHSFQSQEASKNTGQIHPDMRKELSSVSILKAGDTVIAVGTNGQLVCGKVYLRVATGQVIVDVVEIKNKVDPSSL
jgi:transcriptional regulator with XRE-family HTH domain